MAGIVMSGTIPQEAPVIAVIAKEKDGKSSLATTLFDWPNEDDRPLVVAFDKNGPDACARLGKPVPCILVDDQPGATWIQKTEATASLLEQTFANGKRPYSSIVCDCASTFALRIFYEVLKTNTNPDPRGAFGDQKKICDRFFWRLMDLKVPIIWIGWLKEASVIETGSGAKKSKKTQVGGMDTWGKFRQTISGKASVICALERYPVPPNTPDACSDGYMRLLHTKMWHGVACESRYALPDPMPANLGLMLWYIMSGTGGEGAALEEPTETYLPPQPPVEQPPALKV